MATTTPSRDALLDLFRRHGCERVETPVLQPAHVFLDLSGEDIRRRLFVTQDADGRELCLRPEHTIPVCREHLAEGSSSGQYCYLGPVFRHRVGEPSEFDQAGVEWLGDADETGADAAVFGIALEALRLFGLDGEVVVGDMALLDAVLAALELPPNMRRRLVRGLASGRDLDAALAPDGRSPGSDYSGLLAAISGQDPRAAKAFVEDVISIAGLAPVGGRSAAEIAERFLSRAAQRDGSLTEAGRDVLRRYLAIDDGLDGAVAALRHLSGEAGLDLDGAIERFEDRAARIRATGHGFAQVRFSARFTRSLDYYTGFIFEIGVPGQASGRTAIGGGRYDRLLGQLGSREPVPAVGCAFWLDRLERGGT